MEEIFYQRVCVFSSTFPHVIDSECFGRAPLELAKHTARKIRRKINKLRRKKSLTGIASLLHSWTGTSTTLTRAARCSLLTLQNTLFWIDRVFLQQVHHRASQHAFMQRKDRDRRFPGSKKKIKGEKLQNARQSSSGASSGVQTAVWCARPSHEAPPTRAGGAAHRRSLKGQRRVDEGDLWSFG